MTKQDKQHKGEHNKTTFNMRTATNLKKITENNGDN